MSQEQEFAKRLESLKRLAKEQGNCVSEKQVQDAFEEMHLKKDQLQLVLEYLKGQKIGIGSPANPEDYLTDEEMHYLDSYLESIADLGTLPEGEKEAVTLSAMAGDGGCQAASDRNLPAAGSGHCQTVCGTGRIIGRSDWRRQCGPCHGSGDAGRGCERAGSARPDRKHDYGGHGESHC